MVLAGALAAASVLAFVIGAVLIGIGVAMPSSDDDPGDGEKGGGLFSRIASGGSGNSPEKPGYEDGHPVGLYLMTRFWIATGSLEKAVWYFTSDGRVYLNPEDGFSDETLAAQQGRHGTVSVDGDTMTVKWSDGKETSSTIEREKGGFNWDTGIFAPVEAFTDDSQLVGRWEGGTSVSFSGSRAANSSTLDLREDGTFSRAGVASLQSGSGESEVSAGAQSESSGTWKLRGHTLTLTYGDGKVARGITFPFDDEKTRRFYFGGTMYKKL